MTTDMDTVTAQRLQALANGWTPLQNHDKRCFMKGWPTVEVTPELIESWRRQRRDAATGFLVRDGLAVIDLDIDDREAIDEIADRIMDIVPELELAATPLLVRRGKGAKEAWFVRTDELFSRIHSRSWLKPGASADEGAHRVEIFGGASPRQFGGLGPHTVQDDGVVAVRYAWVDRSPLDTRQSELPVLTKKQFFAIMDAAEQVLRARGWTLVERSTSGESEATRVYDLTEDLHFDIDSGERLSLPELRDRAAALGRDEQPIRCSASWLDPGAKNRSRCIVGVSRGHLTVWESASGVTHVETAAKPREYEIDYDRVAEALKELADKRRTKISSADDAVTAATKLLSTYAFCPFQKEAVVPIWATGMDEGMTLQSFRTLMLPNCTEETGPRGGRVTINPVDIWASNAQRMTVAGLRMRPDKPRPTFEDAGKTWVNTYRPPQHPAEGGSAQIGIDFLAQLFPEPSERLYASQWLAHKYRYPHIPGPALIHVAHGTFGTGRGTLAELFRKLFGPSYVREMPYSMVAGRTYQSQYTDWAADKLMIFVAESAESDGGASSYQSKRDTYEHLKTLIEPNMIERTFITKSKNAFTAMACAGFFIATNHADALPMQQGDRRFAVTSGGEPREPEYWQTVRAWMDDPANIGAFVRWLLMVDLSSYDPYVAPPMTEAKRAMTEMARSDLDRAFDLVIENLPADVLVIDQLVAGIRQANSSYSLDLPDRWASIARKLAVARLFRVGVPDSTNWQVRFETRKYAVYAKTRAAAAVWKTRDRLREEVLKNGSPASTGLPGNVLTGLFKGLGA